MHSANGLVAATSREEDTVPLSNNGADGLETGQGNQAKETGTERNRLMSKERDEQRNKWCESRK